MVKERMGDFALTIKKKSGDWVGRTPDLPWLLANQEADWQLWQQPTSENWGGYPATAVTINEWQVLLIGEFYDRDDEEGLQQFFNGRLPASELNGHFQIWAWNRVEQQWHIWTDRFGTLHSYMASNGQQTMVSTFFAAVTAVSQKQLDWRALTGFFAFGFFPQDLTFFDDVQILRPASHYVLGRDGRVSQPTRYWQWRFEPNGNQTYDAAIVQFADIFHAVMDDLATEERVAVPISGGLDSRSTVAALTRNGRMPENLWSYSYGYTDNSVETKIAKEIAQTRQLPFTQFTIPPYLFTQLPTVMASVEGFQDVTQARQAAITQELRQHADFVVAAHWGDVWLDDMGLVDVAADAISEAALLDHVLHKLEKRGRGWLLENLCKPHVGDPDLITREVIEPELVQTKPLVAPDFRVKAFKTDFWSWRWTTASVRMFQPGAFPKMPFYDTRLADFFCEIPSKWVHGRQFQIDYLKRCAPDLAKIRWQAYDTNLYRTQYFHSWLVPKRAFKKGMRMIKRKQIIQRNWEVQFLSADGRCALEGHLLEPGLKLHKFVAVEDVQSLLAAFYTQPEMVERGYTVSMLLTFSAWLERYG